MSLGRWDPFRNIQTLQDKINKVFEESFARDEMDQDNLTVCAWKPVVDIFEVDDGIMVQVELPGVTKEDVSVEVKDNVLTLKGERQQETGIEDRKYYRRERSFGTFYRAFTLQNVIHPEKIKAIFKHGILEVQIPKPEEEKPRQVKVAIE